MLGKSCVLQVCVHVFSICICCILCVLLANGSSSEINLQTVKCVCVCGFISFLLIPTTLHRHHLLLSGVSMTPNYCVNINSVHMYIYIAHSGKATDLCFSQNQAIVCITSAYCTENDGLHNCVGQQCIPVKKGSLLSPFRQVLLSFQSWGQLDHRSVNRGCQIQSFIIHSLCTININLYAQLGFCYIEGIHSFREIR